MIKNEEQKIMRYQKERVYIDYHFYCCLEDMMEEERKKVLFMTIHFILLLLNLFKFTVTAIISK